MELRLIGPLEMWKNAISTNDERETSDEREYRMRSYAMQLIADIPLLCLSLLSLLALHMSSCSALW